MLYKCENLRNIKRDIKENLTDVKEKIVRLPEVYNKICFSSYKLLFY